MKIFEGDICYPKAEGLIIPNDSFGTMNSSVGKRISKAAMGGVIKDAKEFTSKNIIEIGDYFTTYPGRMNRRGVKKIYHAVIKRLQSDFTSVYIVQKALAAALQGAIRDGIRTISLCGLGIDSGDLDPISVARITHETCARFDHLIEIKIIDDNKEFINELVSRTKGNLS